MNVSAWTGPSLAAPLDGGNRSEVWRGDLRGERVVVRRSRRSNASLAWELHLLSALAEHGLRVPEPVPTDHGDLQADGVVVQRWVDGRAPERTSDWRAVVAYLDPNA